MKVRTFEEWHFVVEPVVNALPVERELFQPFAVAGISLLFAVVVSFQFLVVAENVEGQAFSLLFAAVAIFAELAAPFPTAAEVERSAVPAVPSFLYSAAAVHSCYLYPLLPFPALPE